MARYAVTFDDLVAIARRVGVRVQIAPSSHRGQIGEMGTVVGCTCHHTGTPNSYRPADEFPDFNVVKEGRAGLWNSLSAFGLGRWTTIFVFSEDISWHAGTWYWNGITDGNGHLLGIEAAGVGDWTPFQRAVYPRLVASILLFIGETNARVAAPRHLDGAMPRGRKSDAAHFEQEFLPGKDFYTSVQWLMDNPAYININYKGGPTATATLEDDMPIIIRSDKSRSAHLICGNVPLPIRDEKDLKKYTDGGIPLFIVSEAHHHEAMARLTADTAELKKLVAAEEAENGAATQ